MTDTPRQGPARRIGGAGLVRGAPPRSPGVGVSLRRIWAIRRAVADGTYDADARLELALNALLRDVLRRPRSRKKHA